MTSVDAPSCLALTTDALLTLGADSRSCLGEDGLTEYGTSPAARGAVPFGSCTASTPLAEVHAAAVSLHTTLRDATSEGQLEQTVGETYHRFREGILAELSVSPASGVRIMLSPSGTDAEFLALLVALGDRSRRLCNVVVGPQEVGGGTAVAAAGLHFDAMVPHGPPQHEGTPVSAAIADLVDVETISLRDANGVVRTPNDVDAAAEAIVERALGKGLRVLLHVVAHSKMGVHAPSLRAVRKLQSLHPDDLMVVVDAAQGRVSRQGLIAALDSGFLVVLTGSKFYGGPPFSGALLLPRRFDPAVRTLPPLPAEFGVYFSRLEFPEAFSGFASQLPHAYNLGLLLRWGAAMEAFRMYYEVPGDARLSILRRFERTVPRECKGFSWLELDSVNPQRFADGEERLLESKTTVFPFRMKRPSSNDEGEYLHNAELKQVAHWVNEDISRFATHPSPNLHRLLATKFHLGQPVFKGSLRHPSVMRIALGGALISEVGMNPTLGESLDARLEWLDHQVRGALGKLDWIVGQYTRLVEMGARPR